MRRREFIAALGGAAAWPVVAPSRRRNCMRSFAIAGAVLVALSVGAAAADAPSLVGNWTRTAYSSAQVGESTGYPASTNPSLTHGTGQDWKIKIDAQDGNSFSGTLTGPTGTPQTIVGAFRQDGKHFVFSTDTDSGAGEASSDEMEYCWTASSQRFVGAGCATFKRSARQ